MIEADLNMYDVRHGESEANIKRELYKTKADHAMRLTDPNGIRQAIQAGEFLAEELFARYLANPEEFGRIRVWHTPYYRGQETAYYIIRAIAKRFEGTPVIIDYRGEPFLFEQKAGLYDGMEEEEYKLLDPRAAEHYEKYVRHYGRVYAQSPLGESRMEVVMRVKPHFGTILRDFEKHNIRNVISVSHGVTVRAQVMGWMRYPPEWFDAEKNPGNCWIRHIHGNSTQGYIDEGYIHGERAPLRDLMATQKLLQGADQVYMLKPYRPNSIVPPGINTVDPFAGLKVAKL